MGFFNRRNLPADANNTTADGNDNPTRSNSMSSRDRHCNHNEATYSDDTLNNKPSFGHWLKVAWPDILTMIVMGVIGLGVYQAPPAPSRSFPVYSQGGDVVYPEYAYPLRHEIVPIWLAAVLASLIPIIVFLFMQIRIRSFWDVNNAIIGLLYSLITAAVFQVFLKWLIGGLRPHFLDVCKPAIPATGNQMGRGFASMMYDRKVCTGDENEINDSLESFPSGHTTAAFGGFVFLYLYLNAKLKVWSNYHPAYWKLIVTYMPILGATLIGGALTIDEFHNCYDVLAGAIIGTVMAFSAYRMVYASVWDFRFNHIPLMRHLPFTYGDGPAGYRGFHDALWTRQAGWESHGSGIFGGAPFDATHAPHGSGGVAAEGTGIDPAGVVGTRSGSTQSRPRSISRQPSDGAIGGEQMV